MYCKRCGKEIEDHSKFCRYCGTPVESERTFPRPDLKIDIKGSLFWLAASFIIIIWQGVKPWINLDIPFIASTKIQWYKIFKIFKKLQEFAGSIAYGSESLKLSEYTFIGMIPFLLWAAAGLSILYVAYLLYTKERKIKILEAVKWALKLSMAASAFSIAVLLVINFSLSAQLEGIIDVGIGIIKPTMANYIVFIVSFLDWKVLIPRYQKELDRAL